MTATLSDEEMVRQALDRVSHVNSKAEKARRIGVSEATIRRWLSGEIATPLRKDTRRPLERFLGVRLMVDHRDGSTTLVEAKTNVAAVTPDPEGSPAEQLLHMLGMRAGMRRVARELTNKDLITVAYTIARADGWNRAEFQKLDAWRDAILEEEEEGTS